MPFNELFSKSLLSVPIDDFPNQFSISVYNGTVVESKYINIFIDEIHQNIKKDAFC